MWLEHTTCWLRISCSTDWATVANYSGDQCARLEKVKVTLEDDCYHTIKFSLRQPYFCIFLRPSAGFAITFCIIARNLAFLIEHFVGFWRIFVKLLPDRGTAIVFFLTKFSHFPRVPRSFPLLPLETHRLLWDLHKAIYKTLLLRVVHTFHRVFHRKFSRSFGQFQLIFRFQKIEMNFSTFWFHRNKFT